MTKLSLRDRLPEKLDKAPEAIDPGFTTKFQNSAEFPGAATPTDGPQRATFIVPYQHTVMNLGHEFHSKDGYPWAGLDTGIGGQTDTHIDFQSTDPHFTTTITLGGPVTANPDFERDAVPKSNHGYGLATADHAYHESIWQHYFTSAHGDVIVRAASDLSAVLTATKGKVEVVAGEDVVMTAKENLHVGAGGWAPTDPHRAEPWETTGRDAGRKWKQAGKIAFKVFLAARTLNKDQQKPPIKKANGMKPGSATESTLDGKAVVAANLAQAASLLPGSSVSMDAQGKVSFGAGNHATLWGNYAASCSALMSTTVGGSVADVKGVWAGMIGGRSAGLSGWAWVHVTSKKQVNFSSGEKMKIASKKSVELGGDEDIALSAAEQVAIYTDKGHAFVMADDHGHGYGMRVTSASVQIGYFTNLDKHKATLKESKPYVTVVRGQKIRAAVKKTKVFVDAKKGVRLEKGSSDFVDCKKNGNLAIEASSMCFWEGS